MVDDMTEAFSSSVFDNEPGDAVDQAQRLIFQQEQEAIRASLAADPHGRGGHLVDEEVPESYARGDEGIDVDEGAHPLDEPPLSAEPAADSSDDPFHAGGEDPGYEDRPPSGMHIETP
jgi:hypothetical protein